MVVLQLTLTTISSISARSRTPFIFLLNWLAPFLCFPKSAVGVEGLSEKMWYFAAQGT